MLSAHEIKDIIPHRYPFLLVDKVIEKEEGKRVVGLKNVSINEPFFQGHFPEHPVMPGVLILEALRSEEHTSELQSRGHLVCRLLLEKKNRHGSLFSEWSTVCQGLGVC